MVADMTCRMIQAAGYGCKCASVGRQALAILANPRITVDLLIIDLTLPDMPGDELALHARQQRPEIPLVFISGYPDNREPPPRFPDSPFLSKPYSQDDLASVLQQLLG